MGVFWHLTACCMVFHRLSIAYTLSGNRSLVAYCSQGKKALVTYIPCCNYSLTLASLAGKQLTLSECFKVFAIIHSVVQTTAALTMVTMDVIEEFAADGVLYLELRTTPKVLGHIFLFVSSLQRSSLGLTKKNTYPQY
jgi:Adenosine deaminase